MVIDGLSVLVPWIQFVAGLEGVGRMNQIAVQIVQLKSAQSCFERRPYALGAVVVVPQLRGDEQLVATNDAGLERIAHRETHDVFVAVELGAIEMTKAGFERDPDRLPRGDGVWNQGAEANGRDGTGAMGERYPRIAKVQTCVHVRSRCHGEGALPPIATESCAVSRYCAVRARIWPINARW